MIDYTPWKITDYQKVFISESKQLIEIFKNEIVEIHHYGSTAVKGLPDSHMLDILPVVKNLENIEQYITQMEQLGYVLIQNSQFILDECMFFRREINGLARNILMIEQTNYDAIDRRLAVRDYLREHQEVKRDYAELKMKLARKHAGDYESYKREKDIYVAQLERDAKQWYELLR